MAQCQHAPGPRAASPRHAGPQGRAPRPRATLVLRYFTGDASRPYQLYHKRSSHPLLISAGDSRDIRVGRGLYLATSC